MRTFAIARVWRVVLALVLLVQVEISDAGSVSGSTATITYVRTYTIGSSVLRAEIGVSGGTHDCGTQANIYYFDSDKTNVEVVKSALALAFGAMVAGKAVYFTYDCALASGGYGWGQAIAVYGS